jgi:hypothetical protein
MTDRDYFAAAALIRGMGVLGCEQIAKSCYEMADAMLSERERHHIPDAGKMVENTTNHDAVPAAKAEEPESSVPLRSGSALANTSEPVAWVAFATDGSESSAVYSMREQAQAAANDWGWSFAPLYARLPLTDEDLEALEWFEEVRKPLNSFDDGEYVATLRKLLERIAELSNRLAMNIMVVQGLQDRVNELENVENL